MATGHDVGHVFTQSCDNSFDFNTYIYEICAANNIDISEGPIDDAHLARLEHENFDLILTAGYRYKIPSLSRLKLRGVNIHPSLLPVGRGAFPLPWIILNELEQGGVTLHQLSEKFDSGKLLLQESFPIAPNEDLESLSAKCQLTAPKLVLDLLSNFDKHWDNATLQDSQSSYWNYPTYSQRSLDWSKGVADLDRKCRAFSKAGCYARFDSKNWVVFSLTAWRQAHDYDIGCVVHRTNTETIIAASDGLVTLRYFKPLKSST